MNTNTLLRARGMLAGDAAKALGIGVQTLHYYEREGLIPPPPRSESGYRLYTPELVERVRFIRKAQALGLPLDEVKDILRLAERGTSPCGRVQAALTEKLREVDARLRELRSFRNELAALIRQAPALSSHEAAERVCAIVEEASPLRSGGVATGPLARKRRRRMSAKMTAAASHSQRAELSARFSS